MRVSVKLLGFGFWLFFLNCAQCKECRREDIKYENTEPVGKASYTHGEAVRVNCVTGFSGLYKLKCEKGEWTKSIERPCTKKKCSHPGDTPNGEFSLTDGVEFVFGATVVYTCKKGYEMASRTTQRTCRAQGWDNAVPVCEVVKCPAIRTDEDVTASGNTEEGSYGDVIHFECVSSDKMIAGSSDIYCEETGKWSNAVPKCKDITCKAPVISNGTVYELLPEYQKDAVLKYKCDKGYKAREGIPRCSKFGWTLKPECDEVFCELKSTRFGVKKIIPEGKTIFRAGESVNIICSEKHRLIGTDETSKLITCQDNGEWEYNPVCEVIRCEVPHGQHVSYLLYYFRNDMELGVKKTYSCERGYEQMAAEATCTEDGWTPKPLCAEIICAAPNIPNAEIVGHQSENYKINSRIRYKCHLGFEPEQPVQITCNSQGQWTGIRQCTAMCAAPNIPNANILEGQSSKYKINSRIQYTCNRGFEPEQPVQITCDSQGQWTGIQQCTATLKVCLELSMENGFIHSHPFNKEEIFYSCDTGYKPFTGNWWGSVTCRKGSQSDEPRCILQEECGALPSVHHGKLKQTLHDPETVEVECDPGFVSSHHLIKCVNGSWDKPVCKEDVHCEIPPKVENAVIISKPKEFYLGGSSITYVCRSSYFINGKSTVFCHNGTWEKPPKCQEVTCSLQWNTTEDLKIDNDQGFDIEGPVKPGHTLTFSCTGEGLIIKGQRKITCQANGEWNSPFPKCEEITCELQATTVGVKKIGPEGKNIFRPGERVEITCSEQGWLYGQKETSKLFTCQDNGQWDNEPLCEEMRCNVPRDQRVSRPQQYFKEDMKLGAKQYYYCESGYHKMAEEATCTRDGWTPKPLCAVSAKCGPPPQVNNSDTIDMPKKEYDAGERVEYSCFNKYTLNLQAPFTKYLTCQQGQWRGNVKCLEPCTVTKEKMNEKGIDLAYGNEKKMFAPHNDHITFRCQRGKFQTTDIALRQMCNDGVMILPECVSQWK